MNRLVTVLFLAGWTASVALAYGVVTVVNLARGVLGGFGGRK